MSQDNPLQDQSQNVGNISVDGEKNNVNITFTQIQKSIDKIKTRLFIANSPYKGLKKFEPEDKDRFFGREQLIISLGKELELSGLILLLGASGSGKSSVIRAGLIPSLSDKLGMNFINLTFTPDEDPFESLYASLLSKFKQSEAKIAREVDAKTLTQVIKVLKQEDTQWLIFIDQFEELFTISQAEKRSKFVESLVQLIKLGDHSVKIVMTMRSDFLEKFSPYPNFGKLVQKHIRLMVDMLPDELQLAIEKPVEKHGVVFEKGLVKEMIQDVQGEAGYLPLLQYTLNLLWESETLSSSFQERTLNVNSYRKLGGVRGALQKHVDQIYASLTKQQQTAAKQIFLSLVDIDGDGSSNSTGKAVSRRAYRSELTGELVESTLKELIDQNLLVSNDIEGKQQPTVEIAHEAILSSWVILKEWIKDASEAITVKNRLNEDSNNWKQTKSNDEFWSGSKLEKVLELRKDNTFRVLGGLTEDEKRFVDLSLRWRDRRRQRTIISLSGGLGLTLILMFFAGWQWQRAVIGQINSLASSSKALFSSGQELDALIEALKAGKLLKQTWSVDGETRVRVLTSLQQSVYRSREQNKLLGHDTSVWQVIPSPDGKLLASAGGDRLVKLWKPDGSQFTTLEGHSDKVYSVSFSPDGTLLASASGDKTIKLWKTDGLPTSRTATHTFTDHEDEVVSVSFSPDGKTIASASRDKTVKLWRLDGKLIKTLKGHTNQVRDVTFSKDGRIASASFDKTVRLWSADGKLLREIKGHDKEVVTVSFSPDGQKLISAGDDKTLRLWNLDGKLLKTFKGHAELVWDVNFSPDGKTIASCSGDGTIKLWSLNSDNASATLKGSQPVYSVSFISLDGKSLASSGFQKEMTIWRIGESAFGANKIITGHTGRIWGTAFDWDTILIASASADNTFKLWGLNGSLVRSIADFGDSVVRISFSRDGEKIASASLDRSVKLWKRDGTLLNNLNGHTDWVWGVDFSKDNQLLVSASNDKTIKIWQVSNGSLKKSFTAHDGWIFDVKFSPDGNTLASASMDKTAKLWKLDGTLLRTFSGHSDLVSGVSFSPDGKMLATSSGDKTVKVWQISDGKLLSTLKGHEGYVIGVSFSPDSKRVASASWDHTVRIWGIDGTLVETLKGHSDEVNAVSFSPDGKFLASASKDQTVILWDLKSLNGLEVDKLMTNGCERVKDYLNTNPNVKDTNNNLCKLD
ncbi:WD40 repeat domain-containing protein [Pseudanabaena sp. FACHB-1998]|uniref:WD40 repeat domain-containing protein n=1 Tax=Pseudanabaena sp. FACHB-1998 TaxID=2692858 RepID=UPI0016819811|nr:WD40 repeat domain-containing protein [Pseudanabaena sp. FACHB-1998]MBD2179346.1 WD40 repeat domain-containing protein [Pseudanabaena sp. FACHB-1998]